MNIVIKVSDDTVKKMTEYYKDKLRRRYHYNFISI